MSKVVEQAERILAWHRDRDREVARRLRPGLTKRQIEAVEGRLGWNFPEEVFEFYGWCNGVEELGHERFDDLCFYPGFAPLALEEAAEEITQWLKLAPGMWREGWLPVFGDVSDGRDVVDCRKIEGRSAPVFFFMGEHPEDEPKCLSLAALLETLAECFAKGAFLIDDRGFLDERWDEYHAIGRRLNPRMLYWWTS